MEPSTAGVVALPELQVRFRAIPEDRIGMEDDMPDEQHGSPVGEWLPLGGGPA
jgi:hypothetical protein